MSDDEIKENIFNHFKTLSKDEQIRKITLAGNAEFIIRMLPPNNTNETVRILMEALTRYI
jgi:hypothetical protein